MTRWIQDVEADALQIRWRKRWLTDVISSDEFRRQCTGVRSVHECHDTNATERRRARFVKSVFKERATLDYAQPQVREYNRREGNELGVCTIIFADATRSAVKEVIWAYEDGPEMRNAAQTTWDTLSAPSGTFSLPGVRRSQKSLGTRQRRRLQTQFKTTMFRVYRGRCCVSGCGVPEALEAAHIVAASTAATYDPRNGLLLRSDLHRLFDAGILRVEPRSRKVVLADTARGSEHYGQFHGQLIRDPSPRTYRPSAVALRAAWKDSNDDA